MLMRMTNFAVAVIRKSEMVRKLYCVKYAINGFILNVAKCQNKFITS